VEDGQLPGGFRSHYTDLLYCVGEVPAWEKLWSSSHISFLGSLFYEGVRDKNVLKSMVGNPEKQVFRSWVWKVAKAITNAFEDTVSDLYRVLLFVCLSFLSHLLSLSSLL
jgi:hypothetical protein